MFKKMETRRKKEKPHLNKGSYFIKGKKKGFEKKNVKGKFAHPAHTGHRFLKKKTTGGKGTKLNSL